MEEDRIIEDLELTIHTYANLKYNNIHFENQLREMSYKQITSLKNIHRKGIEEIEKKLNITFL